MGGDSSIGRLLLFWRLLLHLPRIESTMRDFALPLYEKALSTSFPFLTIQNLRVPFLLLSESRFFISLPLSLITAHETKVASGPVIYGVVQ